MSEGATRSPVESTEAPGSVPTRFDWAETPPSRGVVETVAVATNSRPAGLPPLYSRIDLEALDTVLEPDAPDTVLERGAEQRGDKPVTNSFSYGDRDVTVASTGELVVAPA